MKPMTESPRSATIPMQFRWRRQRRKSSSVHAYSKLDSSMPITSGMSLRIIHRMWRAVASATPRSLRVARPVLMNGLPPPSGPSARTTTEPVMKPPNCSNALISPPPHPCPRRGEVFPSRPLLTEEGLCPLPSQGRGWGLGHLQLLLVEARALFLHHRRADLVARQLHAEPVVAGHRAADAHRVDHLALHRQRRDRLEHQR